LYSSKIDANVEALLVLTDCSQLD